VIAQTNDSISDIKQSFFNGWKLAGIKISVGSLYAFNKPLHADLFKSIASTAEAKQKIRSDEIAINNYPSSAIEERYNLITIFPLRVVFKPKEIKHNKLKSYIELSAGLTYGIQNSGLEFRGRDDTKSSYYEYYTTDYFFEARSFSLDGLITLQTPGIFSIFSVYTGLGLYAGGDFDRTTYSTASKKDKVYLFSSGDEETTLQSAQYNFFKTSINMGLYMPLGIKFNISRAINLYLEYMVNRRSVVFENSYTYSSWYNGVSLGLRVKFFSKGKKEPTENTSPVPPEPFY
jgi:hypothetical protein